MKWLKLGWRLAGGLIYLIIPPMLAYSLWISVLQPTCAHTHTPYISFFNLLCGQATDYEKEWWLFLGLYAVMVGIVFLIIVGPFLLCSQRRRRDASNHIGRDLQ